MTFPSLPRKARWALAIVLFLSAVWAAKIGTSIYRWKTYIWLINYMQAGNSESTNHQKHLIFLLADHYEPGEGPRGVENARRWLGKFPTISDAHRDSYGNRFRYTWFYAYDHRNEGVLAQLSEMAFRGYGEVEMHWHLPASANSRNFPGMLDEAVAWFQRYGALVTAGPERRTAFAYIAGNWGLDGSRPGWDSVYNQIDVLFKKGCYADFTFSTIGTPCQPRKVNSLYYVRDDPEAPKSYDDGIDARVGAPVHDRLLIFEGPLEFNVLTGALEYGAVESDPRPTPQRVAKWIDADIHVRGRPEWVFVKVYSHGAQSEKVILDRDLDPMLGWLESECRRRGMPLHYMTAREAFNVVKATEQGLDGDPEEYRDFAIKQPLNTIAPVSNIQCMAREGPRTLPPPGTATPDVSPKPRPSSFDNGPDPDGKSAQR